MKAIILISVLFIAGCASQTELQSKYRAPPGGPVADDRLVPSEYLPAAQLDRPPREMPAMGDQFDDRVSAVLKSTGPQTVIAVLLVNENGKVDDVIVRRANHAFFADEVRDAAKRYRFEPATLNRRPAKWYMELPFEFR
jgi:TonB family protein